MGHPHGAPGTEQNRHAPITRYLIRISVDRYPGDLERANVHCRGPAAQQRARTAEQALRAQEVAGPLGGLDPVERCAARIVSVGV
ncbi:hypothetical protein GCM10010270_83040 [Streptomyces violaceus]|nr:hypothetical protein GCM10010270_83040 [Streptomyces janthinus]